jgi:hypothetical protein
MKICTKCGVEKEVTEFYARKDSPDGRRADCKACNDLKCNKYKSEHREERLEYWRGYNAKPENTERRHANQKAFFQENKERLTAEKNQRIIDEPWKDWACNKVEAAILNGKLVRQPCEECYTPNAQAHHDDYTKPLSVRWLCSSHHQRFHKAQSEEEKSQLKLNYKAKWINWLLAFGD